MSLHRLDNVIQNYTWGSATALSEMFNITNPNNHPQAEIWMGAHPNGCSKLSETGELLSHRIERNKQDALGEYTQRRFGELPYLFKVLAAQMPLSIQVHPSKLKAEQGFARENEQGIEISAANRNYKDPNHKPELVYALTFYRAMNGFRPIEQIVALFEEAQITTLANEVNALKAQPNSDGLRAFFSAIMLLQAERKEAALSELYLACERGAKTALAKEAFTYSREFSVHYQDDIGLFAPLMLNTIELAPGEAMFLQAETPHAYVQGVGLEIMANSDNVLRAGLTPKHIDVEELINNTRFESIAPQSLKLVATKKATKLCYPVPVDDFCFDVLSSSTQMRQEYVRSPEIVFCLAGEVTVSTSSQSVTLTTGDSLFICHSTAHYSYHGVGTLARAYN